MPRQSRPSVSLRKTRLKSNVKSGSNRKLLGKLNSLRKTNRSQRQRSRMPKNLSKSFRLLSTEWHKILCRWRLTRLREKSKSSRPNG